MINLNDRNNKKLYNLKEIYLILYDGLRTFKFLRRAKKKEKLDDILIKKIMLAVTKVNNCQMCSYAHTKSALSMGISNEEIIKIMSGIYDDLSNEELTAILFAEHYADSRGNPSKEAWGKCLYYYGDVKAKGILGAIRVIMIGNVYGIAMGSFINRFRFKSDKRSSLFYELLIIISSFIIIPIAIISVFISKILKRKLIIFKEKKH